MLYFKQFKKTTASIILVIVLLVSFSPISTRKAEAFIFTDWVNFAVNAVTSFASNTTLIKEIGLDGVAWSVINLMIEKMAASTVNWINSGFRGSPAYVTNPALLLRDTANQTVGAFIQSDPRLNFLCGPIQSQIRIALINSYAQNNLMWQCTLTDAVGNMQDFLDDFDRGGWDKFFEISQRPQNNPIGAYIMAESALNNQLTQKLNLQQQELSWGRGFLSFKKCTLYEGGADPTNVDLLDIASGGSGNRVDEDEELNQIAPPKCVREETQTPGAAIQDRLNQSLGSGQRRLEVADEINEIVGALLNQLANKALGGLRGLTRPDPQYNNSSFINNYVSTSTDEVVNDYFNNSQEDINDVLNTPIYNPYLCRDNPTAPECLPPSGDPNNQNNICLTNPYAEGCSLDWGQGQPQNPPGETNP